MKHGDYDSNAFQQFDSPMSKFDVTNPKTATKPCENVHAIAISL